MHLRLEFPNVLLAVRHRTACDTQVVCAHVPVVVRAIWAAIRGCKVIT